MKKNMGSIDRVLRVLVALSLIALYYFEIINEIVAIIGLAVAVIFIATSFVSFCPIYWGLGLSSLKRKING